MQLNPGPVVRRILLVAAVLLLLGLTWTGVGGGLRQLPQSQGVGQTVQSWGQLLYGVLSGLAAVTAFRGRRWASLVLIPWAASLTMAGGLAPVVWGDTGWGSGLLAGAAAALIALAIIWLLRIGGSRAHQHPDLPRASS